MGLLNSLWLSSLLMAALALIWMSVLVLARLGREKSNARRARDRRAVLSAFVAIMGGSGDAAAQLSPFQRRPRLMAEALLEALSLIRGPERERLIAALVALNIDDRLRARLFVGEASGRIACAEALGAFPSDGAVEALRRAWRTSRDPALRLAAIRSLTELGQPPRLGEVLDELDRRSAEPLTFQPLMRLVAQQQLDDALDAFERQDRGEAAKAMLADALASTGDYRVLVPLIGAASDASPLVRAAALRALGALGHPDAEPALKAGMTDADWEVRAAASDAAGRIGSIPMIPDLIGRLQDPIWWVRFRAADALTLLGDKGVRSLRLAAAAPSDVVRRAASLALAEKGLA